KREGTRRRGERTYRFVDLPGIYSLTAYSLDEVVACDFLLDRKPDLIIDVLDSTNLERHLYLCLQFRELGVPVVGALNMSDEAEAKGLKIDTDELSAVLGIPLARTVGTIGSGIESLLDLADAAVDGATGAERMPGYGDELEERLAPLVAAIESDPAFAAAYPSRWMAVKLLEKDEDARRRLEAHAGSGRVLAAAGEAIAWIERHFGKDSEIVVSEQRYAYIHGAVKEAVTVVRKPDFSVTEAIDRVVMHPVLALPLFLGVLWSVFQLTFAIGEFPMAWLEILFGRLGAGAAALLPDGLVESLLVVGIIGGLGGVFSFVPLIVLLFFLLSLLEDSGYMSRAAFATDKLLHGFGLHGQSIFPLMLGFGCSVPAIMAARTLKSPRDRIVTILVIPFMSCGAKLPVHVLLAATFFPRHAAAMVMLVYAIGVALALGSSLLLKRTVLKGRPTPFVMELPPWRAPTLRGLAWHVWEKTWLYVKKAGTVILAASILIWAITSFPRRALAEAERLEISAAISAANPDLDATALETLVANDMARLALEASAAGRIGRFIEPIFRPLGFDWKIGVATVTGFAAKEVVVSTLGVLYSVGGEEGNEESLRAALKADPVFNPLVAFSLMLFILVIPPCFAALGAIKAELGWKWLGFSFVYLLTIGWLIAFAVNRAGVLAGLGT
ncbi:MAG TPA: ferrous iron transport protein B, partial [Spirochaetales bacterium]|nr:ferrous iron transport protein B [Spirochaetales bacterium]